MSNIFDKYHKRYDMWYDKHRSIYLSEVEAIRRVLPKKGKGLEIGVGTGRFASALGITAGIDPAKNMVTIARQRGVDARLDFGEDLSFKNASFDYAAIIITLCFVKDPLKVLKEARRILKKNGRIIIGIIDKDNFLGKFYQKKKSVFYKEANFFSVKEVEDLLRAAGFSYFSYYQTIFRLPKKIDSIERPRKGFGKGGFVVISARSR
ncbi:MAG: class I SAM-dependent methyltransferase [Candidatus Omnitrophica bacterium]|nr:class I SAM-dependent methyltransferase [Candidatus Omnitrophota bacterium]MBU4590517.1 class I SAM-dependent methyltransferase [Candidatus Omnitrophota bacterium]